MGALNMTSRRPRLLLTWLLIAVLILLFCARSLLYEAWTLAALPLLWWHHSEQFLLSAEHDGFDITFANYSIHQVSAAPYEDRVPPVLHHVAMGGAGAQEHIAKWKTVRQSCLDLHPSWEAYLWTDESANRFVSEHFPEIYDMWRGYRYPIEKIDALRYMVLYHYGGVILDMDLQCKRSLGPLRRFDFVAPAAHPTGFSVGFMMASQRNEFVGRLVQNLQPYNRHWLLLPYSTVMFSTGCHYASTIHAYEHNRTSLKVLAGTPGNFRMHSLNGHVSTPLFEHLGSSSWHSYDAEMIVKVGKGWKFPVFFLIGLGIAFFLVRRWNRRRPRLVVSKV